MTTTLQNRNGGRPRWLSTLIASVTSAAILAGALAGALVTASPAAAQTTPVFRLDTDNGATTANYLSFLSQIRANVDFEAQDVDNTVAGTTDLVDHTNPNALGYTEAIIVTEAGNQVRLRFRTSDMYLVGWFDSNSQYHYIGPQVEARVPASENAPQQLTDGADYGTLESLAGGINRSDMVFGRIQTEAHALSLWKASSTQAMAAAAVYFAGFVSEATRFRGIQDTIAQDGFGPTGDDSYSEHTTLDSRLVQQETEWGTLSDRFRTVQLTGSDQTPIPLTGWFRNGFGDIVEQALNLARDYTHVLMLGNGYPGYVKRRHLTDAETLVVAADGSGDYTTVQAAIDAVPSDGLQYIVLIEPGTYHEVITVPASKAYLFIKGDTTNAADVVITADRAHGMTDPTTGQPYGTQGSAVATIKANDVTVANVTIQNTFTPANHPEVDAYSTQAVALAAEGDRQTYTQDRIISRQDTILAKAPEATGQYRQYFVGSYIEGTVDFIFGNATAVFDRDNIAMVNWVGGTVLAPNTDKSKKYGILITGSTIYTNGVPANTMYLGRPWHNTADASPQAVVRDTTVNSGITAAHPWTDMTTDYSWTSARFKEYKNTGAGAGVGANAPQMSDSEAADYTARKYLAGTDGWDPVS
ncbi:pectinesterase family protein [Streptomyces prunicolor]|uniref:Pectinesterase n=1 Tax=Streptomyces prunicolor TaxID=67348 RepID=A0ABU4F195_9ACTN|nr:pectinesterase family protein [Streptomyces prunicolor]MCX5243300.1 pectinesterase family protein [Streptomyces prunicolor]MDV7214367.1 pectinesterase family protein [Streptomyces prunicolor]